MNKTEYLSRLEKELKNKKINKAEEILNEYEQHFVYKLADGYTEEEISKALGTPQSVAEQFNFSAENKNSQKMHKILLGTGLGVLDTFLAMIYVIMCATVLVIGAFSLVSIATGFCLITTVNIAGLIPPVPYFGGFVLGLAFLALSALVAVGTIYSFLYVKQWLLKYSRFHSNVYNSTARAPVPFEPNISKPFKRITRKIIMISLIVFSAAFILAFAILAIKAGSFEFWHAYNWFQ